MALSEKVKRQIGLWSSIAGIIGAIAFGVNIYMHFDGRLDTLEKNDATETASTRLQLIDIQVLIIEGHMRDLDRVKEQRSLTDSEQRDLRLSEASVANLNKERQKLLGSPQ